MTRYRTIVADPPWPYEAGGHRWGNDLIRYRIVDLEVVAGEIVAAFQNAVVRASTAKDERC